jgi:splicing factor U2AF 65 kDa subunit
MCGVQVKELLTSFGPLKSFHLVRDAGSQTSKGYAFCEYQDASLAPIACQGLNGLKLGDKTLTVRTAMTQQEAKSAQAAAGSVNSALSLGYGGPVTLGVGGGMGSLGAQAAQLFAQGMGVGGMAMPFGMPSAPATRVLVLTNMVTPDELQDDQEYEDIMDDVREEVSKYGAVNTLYIPRPSPSGDNPPGVGKIYVEYNEVASAEGAARVLQGRQFAQRIVQTTFHDEAKFAARELE